MLGMANQIKGILARKNWSIYKLHQETGMTYNTTHSIVVAERIPDGTSYGTLKKIARALEVKIDDLETDDSPSSN